MQCSHSLALLLSGQRRRREDVSVLGCSTFCRFTRLSGVQPEVLRWWWAVTDANANICNGAEKTESSVHYSF